LVFRVNMAVSFPSEFLVSSSEVVTSTSPSGGQTLCPHVAEVMEGPHFPQETFHTASVLSKWMEPSWPICLLLAPSLTTVAVRCQFQHEFWKYTSVQITWKPPLWTTL
jgi:hypothetical protein